MPTKQSILKQFELECNLPSLFFLLALAFTWHLVLAGEVLVGLGSCEDLAQVISLWYGASLGNVVVHAPSYCLPVVLRLMRAMGFLPLPGPLFLL